MSELEKSFTAPEKKAAAAAAALLLINYSFDLGGDRANELVDRWLDRYPAKWVHFALIEALYQGRYKAISVEQILTIWQRRDRPLYHFKYEFERLICGKLPQELQEQFFSGPSDLAEVESQQCVNATDISAASTSGSTTFEALAQWSHQEVAAKSSIAVGEVKETAVEVASIVAQSDSNRGDRSNRLVADVKFSTLFGWYLGQQPIARFIPNVPSPDFHFKLKSIVYSVEEVSTSSFKERKAIDDRTTKSDEEK